MWAVKPGDFPEHSHYGQRRRCCTPQLRWHELMAILPAEGRLLDQIRSYLKTDLLHRQKPLAATDETFERRSSASGPGRTPAAARDFNLQAAALCEMGPDFGVVGSCWSRRQPTLCEIFLQRRSKGALGFGLCQGGQWIASGISLAVMAERMGPVAPKI